MNFGVLVALFGNKNIRIDSNTDMVCFLITIFVMIFLMFKFIEPIRNLRVAEKKELK